LPRDGVATGFTHDGRAFSTPSLGNFQIDRAGQIYRIDEYLDSAALPQ
jgi:hypothetical protein